MREALYFRNVSFSAKLDSEADVSKYGQIQPHIRRPYLAGAGYENMAGFRPGLDMISGATLVGTVLNCITVYFCAGAVKRYYAKNDNSPFMCFPVHWSSWKAKILSTGNLDLSLLTSYFGELSNKNYIVQTSEMFIRCLCLCYTSWSYKAGCNKRGARPTAKKRSDGGTALVMFIISTDCQY